MKYIIPLFLLICSCGPVQVQTSGQVDLVVKFDTTQLQYYFTVKCQKQNPGATVDVIDTCVSLKMADLFETLSTLSLGS